MLRELRGRTGVEKGREAAGLVEGMEGGTRGLPLRRYSRKLSWRGEVLVGVPGARGGCWAWG